MLGSAYLVYSQALEVDDLIDHVLVDSGQLARSAGLLIVHIICYAYSFFIVFYLIISFVLA